MKIKKSYKLLSILLFIITILTLVTIEKTNNIKLSLVVQIMFILYLCKTIWGCTMYVKDQYEKQKYSYSIIMNLGLIIFLLINISRQIGLLMVNWKSSTINAIYINTINSFSYFALFILPLIVVIAFYSILTNIVLILKEKFSLQNLLGIFFGILIIFGALASQHIYEITNQISIFRSKIYLKKFIDIGLNSVLCYFYCITLATLYANIMAAKHKPDYDKDFVIVLGCKIRKNGTLTPILKSRVDKAIDFAKKQKEKNNKNIIFVPSGGQGQDEIISEAEAMKKYLLKNGIFEENIITEDKSINTSQNMRFSKIKIDEINKDGKIIFSTTNYHVFRSGVIANNEGINCEGIGSKTKWYFYTNALIREFVANLFSQRKKHIALISIINAILFTLIIIGYKYNLL